MGIHQHPFILVPRHFFEARREPVPGSLSIDQRDAIEDLDAGWWTYDPPSEELLLSLRSLFPCDTSWSGCEQYESKYQWGSDVQIWNDEGRVFLIQYRVAPVAQEWQSFHDFVSFATDHHCLLLDAHDGCLQEP